MATALEDDYEICFELITTSALTDAAKSDLEAFQKELAESDTLSANLVIVDNDTLAFKYNDAMNKTAHISTMSFSWSRASTWNC